MISAVLSIFLFYNPVFIRCLVTTYEENIFSESLTPYIHRHGSHLSHREIRDCHNREYGSQPHELYKAHQPFNISAPFMKVERFVKEISHSLFLKKTIRGHYITISDPLKTLSILEPNQVGGCNLSIRQTVSLSAKKGNCVLAVNAGYFDTKKGTCHGNVVSDGRKAYNSQGIQNVHFGLTEDGQIFTGYLSEEAFNSGNFIQLVGGVIWILRNNTGFVNTSKMLECEDSQETGTMDEFVNILSARTVVGHDKNGKVIIIQIDGKSGVDGVNLIELENLLKDFNLVNAVNLDGGGSSTVVIDGVTVNYPYDICSDGTFSCDRKVSTILCVHAPYCDPKNCNNHGSCSMGECICDKNWLPPSCSELHCGEYNCSNNGVCLPKGCLCYPGYYGKDCDKVCMDGWFGSMCSFRCNCINAVSCDTTTGKCICKPGYTGKQCENVCPDGYFGLNCQSKCLCRNACFCDYVTGSCNISHNSSLYHAAKCFAENIIQEKHLVKKNENEKRKWYSTVIVLGIMTTLCLTSLLLVMFISCSCRCRNDQILCSKNTTKKFSKLPLQTPDDDLSDSLSDNELFPLKVMQSS